MDYEIICEDKRNQPRDVLNYFLPITIKCKITSSIKTYPNTRKMAVGMCGNSMELIFSPTLNLQGEKIKIYLLECKS